MSETGGPGEEAAAAAPGRPAPGIAPSVPKWCGLASDIGGLGGRAGCTAAGRARADERVYAALDLGTNNCRLLVAEPSRRGFKVIDAFSRIIRLGEGVAAHRRLSEAAIERTIDALKVCAAKMERHGVERAGLIATEACRLADNAPEFLGRVRAETDLDIKIVSREVEARLAVSGCASLIDASCDLALVFDIGGGSSELIWLDLTHHRHKANGAALDRLEVQSCIVAWTSLPTGVVSLAERYDSKVVDGAMFEAMVAHVTALLAPFIAGNSLRQRMSGKRTQLLGTSGTVTTVAGIHLDLPRYDRRKIDGFWLNVGQARAVTARLLASSHAQRAAQPCVGSERADLVLAGCAILEAVLRAWPCDRLRVADRGLREGILATLMAEDGVYRQASRPSRWRERR
jgi:exopolyphosphatase/guanosine-5'-triphosphate,3'-diphosphate pyrophosphatase